MIQSALYRDPVLVDSVLHRHKKLQPLTDFSIAGGMHAVFITATEFPQAALDFPLVFINVGDAAEATDAARSVLTPIALLGVSADENLHVEGGRWTGRYVPAFIRRFPFVAAAVAGADAPGVFIDAGWPGLNDSVGEPLFDDQGQPAETLTRAMAFLERFEQEAQRTRQFCARLAELDLLKEMQADATLPTGDLVRVDGFLAVDESKLLALPDAVVLELHRNGMMTLLHAHLMSLSNLRYLVQRKSDREAAKAAAPA